MSYTVQASSVEYVRAIVAATKNGVAYDPTADVVYMAFVQSGGGDEDATWNVASWETGGGDYYARCLVGTGGVVLPAGTYSIYVKVTDDPEVPVKFVGMLRVV